MDINFAAVRQTIYAVTAGLLAVGVGFGWITADDQAAISDHVTTIVAAVGALAAVLASANTHPEREPVKGKPEGLPVYDGPTSAVPAPEPYVGRHRLDV